MMLVLFSAFVVAALPAGEVPSFVELTLEQQHAVFQRLDEGLQTLADKHGETAEKARKLKERLEETTFWGRAYADEILSGSGLLEALHALLWVNSQLGEVRGLELSRPQQQAAAATADWLLRYFDDRVRNIDSDRLREQFAKTKKELAHLAWILSQGKSLAPAQQHRLLELAFVGFDASNYQLPKRLAEGQVYRERSAAKIAEENARRLPTKPD